MCIPGWGGQKQARVGDSLKKMPGALIPPPAPRYGVS